MPLTASQQGFLSSSQTAAQQAAASLGAANNSAAVAAIQSQWADESGWGASALSAEYNNYGGIEQSTARPCLYGTVSMGGITYCTYSSISQFASDYSTFLLQNRYASALTALDAGNAAGFFGALQAAGYAGGNTNYASDLGTLYTMITGNPAPGGSATTPPGAASSAPTGLIPTIEADVVSVLKYIAANIILLTIIAFSVWLLFHDTEIGDAVGNVVKQAGQTGKSAATDAVTAAALA